MNEQGEGRVSEVVLGNIKSKMKFYAAYLNEILPFRFCDQRLKFGSGKRINKTGFGNDEQQDLGSRENRQLVCLL